MVDQPQAEGMSKLKLIRFYLLSNSHSEEFLIKGGREAAI